LLWSWRSKVKSRRGSRLESDVIDLIRRVATENRLWGAERFRGELLKLGVAVSKSMIQRYVSRFRSTPDGQRWSTFLRNQARGIWCCDLFEVRDLWFRCHYVFVVMHLETRRLLRVISTTEPTAEWLAPKANAHVERVIGSFRRECLDHLLVFGQAHLQQVLDEYRDYFNRARPHQGLEQRRPEAFNAPALASARTPAIYCPPTCPRGLHHDYQLAS
jgi:putative transposase